VKGGLDIPMMSDQVTTTVAKQEVDPRGYTAGPI
jgi:hypothetical protein